jgi:hypothetical protein
MRGERRLNSQNSNRQKFVVVKDNAPILQHFDWSGAPAVCVPSPLVGNSG